MKNSEFFQLVADANRRCAKHSKKFKKEYLIQAELMERASVVAEAEEIKDAS